MVTKDGDFRVSHRLRGTPRRLLVVATGNIGNDDLVTLFQASLEHIAAAIHAQRVLVELDTTALTIEEG